MAQGGVEKRIAGIIRWLERFQSAYRSGALESALMDAECARADLEDLRLDIWSRVGPRSPRHVGGMACALLSMVLIVLGTAAPLSDLAPLQIAVPPGPDLAGPLPAEPIPARSAPVKAEARSRPKPRPARPGPALKAEAPARAEGTRADKVDKTVPYDKVFSLLQTGERALKNNGESVIKIRAMGKGEGKL